MFKKFITKSNNNITTFKSGLQKDDLNEKVRYDLIPHELLTRLAGQFTRGSKKYGIDNWRKAKTKDEEHLFLESAWRHFVQTTSNIDDNEDHLIACITNLMMYAWHIEHKNEN